MTHMVPNRFEHLTPGQPTPKQRLVDATVDWAENTRIASEKQKQFVLKMALLQEKIAELEETCKKYHATANRLNVSQLKKKSLRLARLMDF